MPREAFDNDDERKARTPYDLARSRLDRLQQNPDKLAPIPQRREAPTAKPPPDFVRNVVGSSAAAGSADFHIYRNNRRKEQNRLDFMEKEYQAKKLDTEYEVRVTERKRVEVEKLDKNRRKRQKQKEREKERRKLRKKEKTEGKEGGSEDEKSSGANSTQSSDSGDDEAPTKKEDSSRATDNAKDDVDS